MIDPAVVSEIRLLLAEGKLSQRKIARLTGISRGTVGAIASGRRPDYDRAVAEEEESPPLDQPPQRCPGCGGMVYMPCRLCRLRANKTVRRRARNDVKTDVSLAPLQLELKPEHRMRFEQVLAWRRQFGIPDLQTEPDTTVLSKGMAPFCQTDEPNHARADCATIC